MAFNYKILIVDDHVFSQAHVSAILQEAGFDNLHTAGSAQEALKILRQTTIHLVIADINMPDMDGVQFIKAMARERFTPMLAIMSICSRRIMNSIALMAEEMGISVAGIIPKPFDLKHAQLIFQTLTPRKQSKQIIQKHTSPSFSTLFDYKTLKTAVEHGQIQAWFQPKIDLKTDKIVGAEALCRWNHPEHGFILPCSFLSSIRYFSLERMLLSRMLEDSLDAYSSWKQMGFNITISINLNASLLDNPSLPDELETQVRKKGVPPGCISFELLEDEITEPTNYHMGASRLRLKGFRLAQDDFGRGYSSMYNLITIPFTDLKIDRSFVYKAPEDKDLTAALNAAIQLGKQLGLTVTAEGIESSCELELLKKIECDYAQGFLISPAVESVSFAQLLTGERRACTLREKYDV